MRVTPSKAQENMQRQVEMKLFAALTLVATVFFCAPPALQGTTRSSINISDRDAVIRSWEAEFDRTEPAIEWTGDVGACNGGTTSSAYQLSILQRANWLRRMAGVPDVTYRADLNAQQQAGALISRANQALTHYPDSTLKCFTQTGYDSNSKSNLYLGVYGAAAMDGYVYDPGDNNKAVGHRWWLLHPGLKSMTSGDVPGVAGASGANALHVFDVNWQSTTSRDGFVAWPPPGYVPSATVYPRWSLTTFGNENFSNASVTVTGPNGPLAVSYDYQSQGRIVFVPAGFERAPLKKSADETYNVNVTGVTGGSKSSFSYSVTIVPVNYRPQILSVDVIDRILVNNCAPQGTHVAEIEAYDRNGDDNISVSLVDGEGAVDNARFVVKSGYFPSLVTKNKLDGTIQDFSVRLRVTDVGGRSNEGSYTFSLKPSPTRCKPASSTVAGKTTQRTVNGSITRRTSQPLRSFTAIPTGNVGYGVSGNCSLSDNKKRVIAGNTKGSCVVVIIGQTPKIRVTLYLQVR